MVCNDNLRALVIGGNPPEEVLQEVRMALVAEFHELSGGCAFSSLNNRDREVTLCKVQILGLSIAAQLLAAELPGVVWETNWTPAADGRTVGRYGREELSLSQECAFSSATVFRARAPGDETVETLAGRSTRKYGP